MLSLAGCRLLLALCATAFASKDTDYLKDFIKIAGSLNPNTSVVNYINGSIYGKQPGSPLQQIFLFEGYNINRKILQTDGSYLSLSREFVIYRDRHTSQILRVSMNPWTSQPNEVFWVANDPVDANLDSSAAANHKTFSRDHIVFNTDVILEYPNVLSPDQYPKYSAGKIYDGAELFSFFANLTELEESTSDSVSMTASWFRKSQYLPWMEMGTNPGGLYYTALSWKCSNGLGCVADDIMELVRQNHPEYQTAPTVEVDPNETSWSVFKKIVDKRRLAGLPDIIIPTVNITTNISTKVNSIDDRVMNVLMKSQVIDMALSGRAMSEITGRQAEDLFAISGYCTVDFEPLPRRDGYRIQLDGAVRYQDANGTELKFWRNPITGRDVLVQNPAKIQVDLVFKNENFFTIDIPSSKAVGLIAAQSSDDQQTSNQGNWSVNLAEIFFKYSELARVDPEEAKFYGTVAIFSNWLNWMDMDDVPGTLVTKATIYK